MTIKTAVSQLAGGAVRPADGIGSERIAAAERRLRTKLPAPLKELYALAGNLEMCMTSFERIAAPEELEIRRGKLYFAEENQGVCVWAVDLESSLVYQEAAGELCSENLELEAFLLLLLFYNCAQGGYAYSAMTGSLELDALLPRLSEGWSRVVDHRGLLIYAKADHLLWWFLAPDGKPLDGCVYLSARTEAGLEAYGEAFEMTPL